MFLCDVADDNDYDGYDDYVDDTDAVDDSDNYSFENANDYNIVYIYNNDKDYDY